MSQAFLRHLQHINYKYIFTPKFCREQQLRLLNSFYRILRAVEVHCQELHHRLVKSLEKKGMLNVCGFQKSGKQYARQFLPTVTREEYGAVLMEKIGIQGKRSLAKVVTAMIRRPDSNEIKSTDELIRELEMIIEELKEG